MSSTDKNNQRHLAFKPFRLVTMPYRHWVEKRRLAQELQEEQHRIAETTNNQLHRFHEELWSHWPETAQYVRQHIRREENIYE